MPVTERLPRVTMRLDGTNVELSASLESRYLSDYRRAIEDTIYARGKRICPFDRLPDVLRNLREAGFDVAVEEGIDAALDSYRRQNWLDIRAAESRIDAIDQELFAAEGKRLRSYQRTGSRWLSRRVGALLADQQRVGKTLTVIVSIPTGAPVLVVAPATIKEWWAQEIKRWRPSLRVRTLRGRDSFRWPEPGEILVTNYEILPNIHVSPCKGYLPRRRCTGCREILQPTPGGARIIYEGHTDKCDGFLPKVHCPGCHPMLAKVRPGTVVVGDEIHRVKEKDSTRALRFRCIAHRAREAGGRSWGTSGTPMQNHPRELWYVLVALGIEEESFDDWPTFKRLFKGKRLDYGAYRWGIPDEEAAERIRRVALRRLRSDVASELPPTEHETWPVPIEPELFRRCDAFVKHVGGMSKIAELVQKKEIKFTEMERIRTALASAKIPVLLDLVRELEEDGEGPLLVFSMHRSPIDTLAKLRGWDAIHGDVPQHKRQGIVDRFQRGELKGLALSIKSAGEGLNLSRADRAIFVDLSWNPMENEQAEDRFVDLAQDHGKLVTVLTADHPLDRRIVEVCLQKRRIIAASVDASSAGKEHAPGGALVERLRCMRESDTGERRADDDTIARLESASFSAAVDDLIARDLAEEARVVGGLTAEGWQIAQELLARAASPDKEETMSEFKKLADKMTNKERVKAALYLADLMSEDARDELFEELDAEYADDEEGSPESGTALEDPTEDDEDDEDESEEAAGS